MVLCPACQRAVNEESMYFRWLHDAGYSYSMENNESQEPHTAIEIKPLPTDILTGTALYASFCQYLNNCNIRSIPFHERMEISRLLNHLYKNGAQEVEPRYNYRRQMYGKTR